MLSVVSVGIDYLAGRYQAGLSDGSRVYLTARPDVALQVTSDPEWLARLYEARERYDAARAAGTVQKMRDAERARQLEQAQEIQLELSGRRWAADSISEAWNKGQAVVADAVDRLGNFVWGVVRPVVVPVATAGAGLALAYLAFMYLQNKGD